MSDESNGRSADVIDVVGTEYEALEAAVARAEEALAEAVGKRDDFRSKMMSLLKVASCSKSGQKLKAERVARVAALYDQGVTVCAEIARRTGIPVYLVQGDVRQVLRRRKSVGRDVEAETAAVDSEIAAFAAEISGSGGESPGAPEVASVQEQEQEPAEEEDDVVSDEDEGDEGSPGATLRQLQVAEKERNGGDPRRGARFKTTRDDGHDHVVVLLEGCGVTLPDKTGHMHSVRSFDVGDKGGHSHGLILDDSGEALPRPVVKEEPRSKPGSGIVPKGAAVSRKTVKSALKDHKRGNRKTNFFVTTVDEGHAHVAVLDLLGDGKTRHDDTGHYHRVANGEMIEGDPGHLHGFTLDEP